MPAFAPVLRPPDGVFAPEAEDDVVGDVAGVEVVEAEAEAAGAAEERVDVGPTVAASWKILFGSLQQFLFRQHHLLSPQLITPTLPHWSAY
jgi:hypothetical protein